MNHGELLPVADTFVLDTADLSIICWFSGVPLPALTTTGTDSPLMVRLHVGAPVPPDMVGLEITWADGATEAEKRPGSFSRGQLG